MEKQHQVAHFQMHMFLSMSLIKLEKNFQTFLSCTQNSTALRKWAELSDQSHIAEHVWDSWVFFFVNQRWYFECSFLSALLFPWLLYFIFHQKEHNRLRTTKRKKFTCFELFYLIIIQIYGFWIYWFQFPKYKGFTMKRFQNIELSTIKSSHDFIVFLQTR